MNISNMAVLVDSEGKPHFKYIMEGANLFFKYEHLSSPLSWLSTHHPYQLVLFDIIPTFADIIVVFILFAAKLDLILVSVTLVSPCIYRTGTLALTHGDRQYVWYDDVVATHDAVLVCRPGLRTLIITRSKFPTAGHKVGKWLGDNLSTWELYRISITGVLSMATLFQVPMVGSDICGFGEYMNVSLS